MTALVDRVKRLDPVKHEPALRDAALLIARLGLTWIFVYHGAATLFGAFHGPGLNAEAGFYSSVAHLRPGKDFALLGGSIEFLGGIGVGIGLLGRLAALALAGDMAMAMLTVTLANGIVSSRPGGGYELNVALGVLAAVIALLGPGRLSVDQAWRSFRAQREAHPVRSR